MFAVVQIGSSTRRSACITARMVREDEGGVCARRSAGAPAKPTAAAPPAKTPRRVVVMPSLPGGREARLSLLRAIRPRLRGRAQAYPPLCGEGGLGRRPSRVGVGTVGLSEDGRRSSVSVFELHTRSPRPDFATPTPTPPRKGEG